MILDILPGGRINRVVQINTPGLDPVVFRPVRHVHEGDRIAVRVIPGDHRGVAVVSIIIAVRVIALLAHRVELAIRQRTKILEAVIPVHIRQRVHGEVGGLRRDRLHDLDRAALAVVNLDNLNDIKANLEHNIRHRAAVVVLTVPIHVVVLRARNRESLEVAEIQQLFFALGARGHIKIRVFLPYCFEVRKCNFNSRKFRILCVIIR